MPLTNFATDAGAKVTALSTAEIAAGLSCGLLTVGHLNWLFQQAQEGHLSLVDGQGVDIADGDAVLTPADLALIDLNNSSMARNATGEIEHDDGDGNVFTIPLSPNPSVSAAAVNTFNAGLLQSINKSHTVPADLADIQLAAAAFHPPSYATLQRVLTNRASLDGSLGPMNTNGELGYFSKSYATTAEAVENNGGVVPITLAGTTAVTVTDGKYTGQIMQIYWAGAGATTPNAGAEGIVTLTTTASVLRAESDKAVRLIATGEDVRVRSGELWVMVWIGGWRIVSTFNQFSAANYRENLDGKVTVWGASPINLAAFPAFTVAPTVVDDATNFVGEGGEF